MTEAERRALAALSFNWAPTPDDVWRTPDFHVDGLQRPTELAVLDGLAEAKQSDDASPIGVAVLGIRGTGKTHLLGWVRKQAQADGGYFFLVRMIDASAFWRNVAQSMLEDFAREVAGEEPQLQVFLRRLADWAAAPRTIRRAVAGETPLSRSTLDAFVDMLRKKDRLVGLECQDTARALALRASDDFKAQDIGHDFLCSNDEEEPGERAGWGIRRGKRSPQEVVRDISRLLALTGPIVIAIDQIDVLIAQSVLSTTDEQPREEWRETLLLEQIAGGLMDLRESTRRTLSVVACLPASWEMIKTRATDTVQDRFREAARLQRIPTAELALELVAKRFGVRFREIGFTPPYATWPVLSSAFADAVDFTPRGLLIEIDAHVRSCRLAGEVRELAHFPRRGTAEPVRMPEPVDVEELPAQVLLDLDKRFAALRERADVGLALDPQNEDTEVPALLFAGLTAWIAEQGRGGHTFTVDAPPAPKTKPDLHARLRRGLDDAREDEEHWAFRAIVATHPVAALNRIRNASSAAGLTEGISKRRLFLLRTQDWSPGPRTTEVVNAFEAAGGRRLPFPDSDIGILVALRDLLNKEGLEAMRPWLVTRQPTRDVTFLRAALAGATAIPSTADQSATDQATPQAIASPVGDRPPPPNGPTIVVGTAAESGRSVSVGLEALRRHAVIFAGSGSGKTVLLRRLVEESALHGVSAIVLDPNNDLARLGDSWPEPPTQWGYGDEAKAEEYLTNTEVIVWTPRLEAGRPLSFQPLPDFAGIADDPDAFLAGVEAAMAALAPRAKVDGKTNKAHIGQAVLRQALAYYARQRRSNLEEFIGVLSALPDGVSNLDNAQRIAADLGQTLTATMVNDPMFGGGGVPVDPGMLLTPRAGVRARVSVISFVGLPQEDQRQSFVNQLQLALFAWIKRHPAGDRPLGGLFVMDEAQTLAPSGAMTPCTHSTLALASQARKYGIGLVFATQAPKGLHNRISGNASTQFFGLLNHPVQINAARELARAKGSDVPDIARMQAGEFYAAIEGSAFERIQTPLCLSYHPRSPLTEEEVLERARQ